MFPPPKREKHGRNTYSFFLLLASCKVYGDEFRVKDFCPAREGPVLVQHHQPLGGMDGLFGEVV